MQIYKIDNSNNFKANNGKCLKVISGQMADDSTALVKFTMNKNQKIDTIERYLLKDGDIHEGKGICDTNGLKEEEITSFINKLQENAKAGVNFFKEFTKAMIS